MAIKTAGQNLVGFMIFTLITVMAWIGFDVYRTLNKKTLPSISEEEVKPFDPVLDTSVAVILKERFSPSEEELGKIPETNKIKLEPEKEATPSARLPVPSAQADGGQAKAATPSASPKTKLP